MLWLGDNFYYLPTHLQNLQGMFGRQMEVRQFTPSLNKLLAARPNYAIWDDHDYGPNNSYEDFDLKWGSRELAAHFWPNPDLASALGWYHSFSFGDADFFMIDDRFFRNPEADTPVFLGWEQIDWLCRELQSSSATFKFVAFGSQVLTEDYQAPESFSFYEAERNYLFEFIVSEQIEGVVFLSGDRHFTELSRKKMPGGYPLYNFTSSPMLSPMNRTPGENGFRVAGTLVKDQQNYGKIRVEGPVGDRVCILETRDRLGELLWKYEIRAQDLTF